MGGLRLAPPSKVRSSDALRTAPDSRRRGDRTRNPRRIPRTDPRDSPVGHRQDLPASQSRWTGPRARIPVETKRAHPSRSAKRTSPSQGTVSLLVHPSSRPHVSSLRPSPYVSPPDLVGPRPPSVSRVPSVPLPPPPPSGAQERDTRRTRGSSYHPRPE